METLRIPHLKEPDEFFSSPQENHILEDIQTDIRNTQRGLLDEVLLRQQDDWSFLRNRVVGSEED